MSSVTRATTKADATALSTFLRGVFQSGDEAPFVNPQLQEWKYWLPRADCPENRSLVVTKDDSIAAHVALWPVGMPGGQRGVHMIDWASGPLAPGAGVALLQRLTKSYDFVYAIGGSDMTRAILPKFGLRVVAETSTYARPLRPLRQMLLHQSRNARLAARLARNAWWAIAPRSPDTRGWELQPAPSGGAGEHSGRGDDFFTYFRKCPAAQVLCFRILRDGVERGFFALSVVGPQARLAGIWPQDEQTLGIFLQLAQNAAIQHTKACELIFRSAAPAAARAAFQAGMRERVTVPVFLFQKKTHLEAVPLYYQLLDDDGAFLSGGGPGFLT